MSKKSVDSLKLWDKNPREITKEKLDLLKKYLKKYGLLSPLKVTPDGEVLGGNHRLKAIRELGWKEVWVHEVNPKSEAEKIEIALIDNQEFASYVEDQLRELILDTPELELDDFSISLTSTPLTDLLPEDEVVEDEPPELDEGEPVSKLGEVYQLGRHRLMCGDSTKIEDVEKLMDGKKADMVFTDPPYNINYQGGMHADGTQTKRKKILNDNFKNKKAFYQFLYDSISAMRPFVSGDVYIFMSSSELHTLQKAFTDAGGHWSTFIIWVKNHFTLTRSNYQRQYEPILYGWFEGSSHYWSGIRKLGDVIKPEDANIDLLGNVWLKADNLSSDIWEFDKPTKSREHPTMKPIKLCARGIVNSSQKNGFVLDTFSGSGSTLIACEQTNRICYGMELDPKYVDVIRKRYAKFIGKEDSWQKTTPMVDQQ